MKTYDLIDDDFKILMIKDRAFYQYKKHDDSNTLIFNQYLTISTINWGLLYKQLLKRTQNHTVLYGKELTDIHSHDDKIQLTFNNTEMHDFDFVIFADGVNSFGRNFLHSQKSPSFAGYIAWRGKIDLKNSPTVEALLNKQPLYLYDKGVGFFYLIPSAEENIHTLNLLIYEKITPEHPFFKNNFSPTLQDDYIHHYRELVNAYFPAFARDLFLMVDKPFIQPIQDLLIDTHFRNNMLLTGDASTVLQPVTVSGALKGISDAIDLYEIFKQDHSIEKNLDQWNTTKFEKANNLFTLGKRLSDFYVLSPPPWESISQEEINVLWENIVRDTNWYMR